MHNSVIQCHTIIPLSYIPSVCNLAPLFEHQVFAWFFNAPPFVNGTFSIMEKSSLTKYHMRSNIHNKLCQYVILTICIIILEGRACVAKKINIRPATEVISCFSVCCCAQSLATSYFLCRYLGVYL